MIYLGTLMGQGGMGIENDGEKILKKRKRKEDKLKIMETIVYKKKREIKENWRERRSEKGFKVSVYRKVGRKGEVCIKKKKEDNKINKIKQ